MAKKKTVHVAAPPIETTPTSRFFAYVAELERIMHPSVTTGLMATAHEMREEVRQATIREVVEDKDLQHMRDHFLPLLQKYRKARSQPGCGPGPRMYLRQLMREIVEFYSPQA